jgi:hypothetical protein
MSGSEDNYNRSKMTSPQRNLTACVVNSMQRSNTPHLPYRRHRISTSSNVPNTSQSSAHSIRSNASIHSRLAQKIDRTIAAVRSPVSTIRNTRHNLAEERRSWIRDQLSWQTGTGSIEEIRKEVLNRREAALEALGESVEYWSNEVGGQLTESSKRLRVEGALRRVRGEQDLRSLARAEKTGINKGRSDKERLESSAAEMMRQRTHSSGILRLKVDTCLEAGVEAIEGKTAGSVGVESRALCKVCRERFWSRLVLFNPWTGMCMDCSEAFTDCALTGTTK